MRATPPLILLACLASLPAVAQLASVRPAGETQVVVRGGAGDQDVALWPNSANPAQSLLVVADSTVGLTTYRLDTTDELEVLQGEVAFGVDVEEGFALPGGSVPLVVVANGARQALTAYVVDAVTLRLRRVDTDTLRVTNFDPRVVALYRNPANGQVYAFAADSGGTVQQFELRTNTTGGVEGTAVRTFEVGGAVSGMVADEAQGVLFVAQQNQGIWRYSAAANGGTARTAVASAGQGALAAPLGGLALYSINAGGGYLLAASTSGDSVAVYGRQPPHDPLGSFRVIVNATGSIDAVTGPRSIEASSRALGTTYPTGIAIVHDTLNSPAQNHKLVAWRDLVVAFTPPLAENRLDGGSDGGVLDGGTDGGTGRDGGPTTGPGGGTIDPDPESGCGCATASVSGTVLFVLLGLALRGRRRQR
ncbi:MAG TPA: phytase [Myxococcaceae bacterium]|nr:phytase [Myxococcaceae bacterium]